MAIGPLANVFNYLNNLGFMDIILPFAIIFAIVWAVLKKVKLFDNDKISVILALSIALISIIPHATGTYQEYDVVNFINTTFPQVGLILISLVLLMVVIGLLGGKAAHDSWFVGIAGILGVILLLVVFWRALFPYQSPSWLSFLDDPNTQALVIILLVFGLIVYFVTKKSPGETGYVASDPGKSLSNFLKGFYGGGGGGGTPP